MDTLLFEDWDDTLPGVTSLGGYLTRTSDEWAAFELREGSWNGTRGETPAILGFDILEYAVEQESEGCIWVTAKECLAAVYGSTEATMEVFSEDRYLLEYNFDYNRYVCIAADISSLLDTIDAHGQFHFAYDDDAYVPTAGKPYHTPDPQRPVYTSLYAGLPKAEVEAWLQGRGAKLLLEYADSATEPVMVVHIWQEADTLVSLWFSSRNTENLVKWEYLNAEITPEQTAQLYGIWEFDGFFDVANAPAGIDVTSEPIPKEYRVKPKEWLNGALVFHYSTFYMGQDSCTYPWAFEEIFVLIRGDIQQDSGSWFFVQVDEKTLHAFNGMNGSISVYEKSTY